MVSIYNEDLFVTMKRMEASGQRCNVVLTSPPYNTGKHYNTERGLSNRESRYDIHMDTMTSEEYTSWVVDVFNALSRVLEKDGVVLWNMSYGNDARDNPESIGLMWLTVAEIIKQTEFVVADRIVWKKKSAMPINTSRNKLTRICEDIFVFCRKSELKTFNTNKKCKGQNRYGQKYYEVVYNFVEARNNDGKCDLNKATYSTELCEKLLSIYACPGDVVYDPFVGTGTTCVACVNMELDCIASEISEAQCEYAKSRLESMEVW